MPQQQQSMPLPYKTVVAKPEDSKKVFIFVSFTCPVCAAYDDHLIRWSQTLPRDWDVEFVPVTLPRDRDSVIAARAFYAAKAASPNDLDIWMPKVYGALQTTGDKIDDPRTWQGIASSVQLTGYDAAWRNVQEKDVEGAYRKLVSYGIDATPSIAIGGKYIITPDNTNGNEDLFFQLANGMVSKSMAN
jgi:protein dithiol oxidoreductase (disulfide-forming)